MASLVIKKLKYSGDRFYFESPEFGKGLNIIEASNGSGKTTFFMLLYYSLGGTVEQFSKSKDKYHKQIVEDKNGFVETDLFINDHFYKIKRHISKNEIIVTSKSDINIFPVNRGAKTKERFSDWLLSELGIPKIQFAQGYKKFFLSFYDYIRLIYHNQQPDPNHIYKKPDRENFYSDSREIRKAIFQILIGEYSIEYYKKLAEQKQFEMERGKSKNKLEEYEKLVREQSDEIVNTPFILKQIQEKSEQLQRLKANRKKSKKTRSNIQPLTNINDFKSDLLNAEIELATKKHTLVSLQSEKSNFLDLRRLAILELSQIKKIISTHEQLNLFSADVCPYCLREIERKKDHCVCGSIINEADYERFFYNHEEYVDIWKSKQKSLNTIDDAISGVSEKVTECNHQINK